MTELQKVYIAYQRLLHPDKFVNASQQMMDASTTVSAYTSNAYNTLTNELDRTVYYLKLLGINPLEEECRADQSLVMEVFAIREEIDEAETEQDLDPIHMEV